MATRTSYPAYPASQPLDADGMRRLPEGVAASTARAFDLTRLDAAFFLDPYPVYHALRMHAPALRTATGGVVLTRYADLIAVYKDTTTFSSDKKTEFRPKFGDGLLYEHHTTSLVFNDPPLHTRVRRIIAGAMTARAIGDMEQPIIALVDRLLDVIAEKGGGDLIEDFAAAIPIEVIGNMLGVPHSERGPLRGWSLAILGALEPAPGPERLATGERAVAEFVGYLEGLVRERRQHPRDPDKDVLTRLIQGESDGARLSERELLQNCIFILNAGHETTTNLIGNGLVALADWPEQRRRLIEDPGLIKPAVEEFLRFESSNQLGNRIATQTAEVGGVALPPGTQVTLVIGAANRDPDRFPRPDCLNIARNPNRHLAFASGAHQCVGMNVARLESTIAIGRFLARFPRYALTTPPRRSFRARFRGYLEIPFATHGDAA